MSGDFEILRLFYLCVRPPVCVDFEILRFFLVCGKGGAVVGTLKLYIFFLCVGGGCGGDFEILRFFSTVCVCGATVSGDFEILLFLPVCVRTLRVYVFFPMCGASVCMGTLRFCVFPLCVGPVLETLKIFKKNLQ